MCEYSQMLGIICRKCKKVVNVNVKERMVQDRCPIIYCDSCMPGSMLIGGNGNLKDDEITKPVKNVDPVIPDNLIDRGFGKEVTENGDKGKKRKKGSA